MLAYRRKAQLERRAKNGTRELFYRKSDLALSHETRNRALDYRNTPP